MAGHKLFRALSYPPKHRKPLAPEVLAALHANPEGVMDMLFALYDRWLRNKKDRDTIHAEIYALSGELIKMVPPTKTI